MILYKKTIEEFIKDIDNNQIDDILNKLMKLKKHKYVSKSENRSWTMSLKYMAKILTKASIPKDCYVAIEYNIPMTNLRIDFILFGYDELMKKNAILFELKQWSKVSKVQNTDILLETFVGGSVKQVLNPVYQIWTYQELLKDYNANIQKMNICISSCVIMHNYTKRENDIVSNKSIEYLLDDVSIFYKDEDDKIVDFISKKIQKSDNGEIIKFIEESKYTPSKKLQNNINELITHNDTFRLIDEQRIIYEKILIDRIDNKRVIIVNGGPGTGKSLIAINLLCEEIKKRKNESICFKKYCAKNSIFV